IAGLPFPNGGTLGPDLTGVYHKLGPQGIETAMKTLYFHVMTSIYDQRPLTLQERADLVAFFEEAASKPTPRLNTQLIALIAFIGFLILLSITRFVWRDRLKSVRRTMVERAMRQGGFHS
ncbi:MAG: c-type cytochrome, partial [Terriglobia bacterium]